MPDDLSQKAARLMRKTHKLREEHEELDKELDEELSEEPKRLDKELAAPLETLERIASQG
jgi:hypothetical protein